jgi:hypothetical protein
MKSSKYLFSTKTTPFFSISVVRLNVQVHGSTIFSSCSDGHVYLHSFPPEGAQPHYEMAVDAENDTSTNVLLSRENRSMAVDPEQSTEVCEGPKRCKTGKTGLVKSSSSFQVKSLKSYICFFLSFPFLFYQSH